MWRCAGVLAVVGCSERVPASGPSWDSEFDAAAAEEEGVVDTGDAQGACGDVHEIDIELAGILLRPDGTPVAGAPVWLELRDWGPRVVHGTGVTGPDGRFRFDATGVPIVEGCWAIGPQFWAVAQLDGLYAEDGANMEIVQAWLDGSQLAALYQPLVTEQ